MMAPSVLLRPFARLCPGAILVMLVMGCQGGGGSAPVAPSTPPPEPPTPSVATALPTGPDGRRPLGVFDVLIDTTDLSIALLPIRTAQAPGDGQLYAVDASDYFSNDVCKDCLRITGLSFADGFLSADLAFEHPFPLPATPGEFAANERLDLHVFDLALLIRDGDDAGRTLPFPATGEEVEPDFLRWGPSGLPADGYTDAMEAWFEANGFPNAATLDPFVILGRSSDSAPDGNFDAGGPNGFGDLRDPAGFNVFEQGGGATIHASLNMGDRTEISVQIAILGSYMRKSGLDPVTEEARQHIRQRPIYRLPADSMQAAWRVQATSTPVNLSGANRDSTISVKVWDWQQAAPTDPQWTPNSYPRTTVPNTSKVSVLRLEAPAWRYDLLETANLNGAGRGQFPLTGGFTLTPTIVPPTGRSWGLLTVVDTLDGIGNVFLSRDGVESTARVRTWQMVPFDTTATPLVLDTADLNGTAIIEAPYLKQFNANGGVAPYSWAVLGGPLPGWAHLAAATGILSGTVAPPLGVVTRTIKVTDAGRPPQTMQAEFTLTTTTNSGDLCDEPDPAITTEGPLPDALRGEPYDFQLEATGGRPPLQFTFASGALPPGLTLGADGHITGTPLDIGSGGIYEITFRVQDSCPLTQFGTRAFTLNFPCTMPEILTNELPFLNEGDTPPPILGSGEPPLVFTLVSGAAELSQAGLTFNSDGTFGGAVVASVLDSFFPITVRLTDGCGMGQSVERGFFIAINCAPGPVITSLTLPDMALEEPRYEAQLTADFGVGALEWRLIAPQTAPLNTTVTADGRLIIDPVVKTDGGRIFSISVGVSDSCSTAQSDFEFITLAFPCASTPVIDPAEPPTPEIGVPYSFPFTATDGVLPLQWRHTGELPPGLAIDPFTGVLSGTVTASASGLSYDFYIGVGDDCGPPIPGDHIVPFHWDFP